MEEGTESHTAMDDTQGWTRLGVPVLTSDASGWGLGGWLGSDSYTVKYTDSLKRKLPHIGTGELIGNNSVLGSRARQRQQVGGKD